MLACVRVRISFLGANRAALQFSWVSKLSTDYIRHNGKSLSRTSYKRSSQACVLLGICDDCSEISAFCAHCWRHLLPAQLHLLWRIWQKLQSAWSLNDLLSALETATWQNSGSISGCTFTADTEQGHLRGFAVPLSWSWTNQLMIYLIISNAVFRFCLFVMLVNCKLSAVCDASWRRDFDLVYLMRLRLPIDDPWMLCVNTQLFVTHTWGRSNEQITEAASKLFSVERAFRFIASSHIRWDYSSPISKHFAVQWGDD